MDKPVPQEGKQAPHSLHGGSPWQSASASSSWSGSTQRESGQTWCCVVGWQSGRSWFCSVPFAMGTRLRNRMQFVSQRDHASQTPMSHMRSAACPVISPAATGAKARALSFSWPVLLEPEPDHSRKSTHTTATKPTTPHHLHHHNHLTMIDHTNTQTPQRRRMKQNCAPSSENLRKTFANRPHLCGTTL